MNARTDQRLPPATKKTDMHSFRGPIPLVRPPSPSSWCFPVRSRRTGGISSGDRSWFGRPQAKKRRQGMPPGKRGRTRRTCWTRQQHHPLQAVSGDVGALYELPKKRRVPNPSPYDASSPHRREQIDDDGTNTYESSPSRQNVAGVRQPRKRRVP